MEPQFPSEFQPESQPTPSPMQSAKAYLSADGPKRWIKLLVFIAVVFLIIWGLSSAFNSASSSNWPEVNIYSGSENQTLEPLVKQYADQQHIKATMHYEGSVDIMMKINSGSKDMDAAWLASSLWLNMSDSKRYSNAQSIMRSPVVFSVKKSRAQQLGWVGKEVTTEQILQAITDNKIKFAMTSATQSNSGASAFLAFLYAFSGNPDVLDMTQVQDPAAQQKVRQLLHSVDRSSGSSGWLKDMMYSKYDSLDAMVNYESLTIELNQKLTSEGKEPLYVIYPKEGVMTADSPLAYINNGDSKKADFIKGLQTYLLSKDVQQQILGYGRRTGIGSTVSNNAVFNADWGIKGDIPVPSLKLPKKDVIQEALSVYQVSLRKPSFTVYAVDVSGSMSGNGITQLKAGLETIINQQKARNYFLQATAQDVTVILPFNSAVLNTIRLDGNDPAQTQSVLTAIQNLDAGGGTDIYAPIIKAFSIINGEQNINNYFPSVILMTDGKSNVDRLSELPTGGDIPVYSIEFGDADASQLNGLASRTSGIVFDGRKDLVAAFRKAKGYN